MELESYIPFKEKKFRVHQKEAIEEIIQAIDDGNKNIILNAPVGSGKGLIAYVLSKYYESEDKSSYIYTKTKYLQSQYTNDFKDIALVKGRNNFRCANENVTCDEGTCKKIDNFNCPFGVNEYLELKENDYDTHCPYWEQKINGINASITLLNYTYALTDSEYIRHFDKRYIAMCDEGHNIEKEIMGIMETTLSPKQIKKDIGVSIPTSPNSLTMQGWIDLLNELSGKYKDAINSDMNKPKKDRYIDRAEALKRAAYYIDENINNWVVKNNFINKNPYIAFKPIMVDKYTDLIFDKAFHNVIMSGSILKPDLFAKELGLEDYYYIEIPSIIPKENRIIRKEYCGSMSNRYFESNFPKLRDRIEVLANFHSNEKGVIHTYTYKIANRLKEEFGDNPRFIFHDSSETASAFSKFKHNSPQNAILVSPVAFEGVDFPYDDARWQAICKDPFPNIGDVQISARDLIDYGWIFRQRCLVLSQMYGRSNRAPDDYSVTYLLDSNLENLLGPSTLVTDYFLEGMVDLDYDRPFELSSNAYNKLSKDVKRSYANERFEEKCMLDAIKHEGLNTLGKIRKEYKKIPNDSYKLVMPAIDRLLKNDAIHYIE